MKVLLEKLKVELEKEIKQEGENVKDVISAVVQQAEIEKMDAATNDDWVNLSQNRNNPEAIKWAMDKRAEAAKKANE